MFNFFKKKKKYKISWQYFLGYNILKSKNYQIVKAYSEADACSKFLREMPLPIEFLEIKEIED